MNYVLLGLTLLTMTGSLAWDVYLDQKGCCDITDACEDREVYEKLSETLETKSDNIDAMYTNGKSFTYIQDTTFCIFVNYRSVFKTYLPFSASR